MKQIYRFAQKSFESGDGPNPRGKVFQMGYIDGYLAGFGDARLMALDLDGTLPGRAYHDSEMRMAIERLGEKEEEPICGAV